MKLNQLTLSNIKGFIQGNVRKILDDLNLNSSESLKEQVTWRLKRVEEKSPECFRKDECIHCGCQVSAKVFEDRECEHGCYPKMMSDEDWQKFKDELYEYNILDGFESKTPKECRAILKQFDDDLFFTAMFGKPPK